MRPPERDITYTSRTVPSPAANANADTVQLPRKFRPNAIEATAPTTAPEEIPMTPGSARGLPKTPCKGAAGVAFSAEPPVSAGLSRTLMAEG